MFENYYMQQQQHGHGMPVFAGVSRQRGHGLGSMLSGLFRRALPIIKRGLSIFGKNALKTGLQVASDVADGGDWKESAKRHVPSALSESIKRFREEDFGQSQTGSGGFGPRRSRRKSKAPGGGFGGITQKKKRKKSDKNKNKNKKKKQKTSGISKKKKAKVNKKKKKKKSSRSSIKDIFSAQ